MTGQVEPGQVVVAFSPGGSAELKVHMAPDVTIGQLQLAAIELTELAREARAGQRMQLAQQRLETAALAASIRNGGRA